MNGNQKVDRDEFLYYLHGTEDESAETLEDIFNHGLKNEYATSIGSTMKEISKEDIEKFGLSEVMKSYTSGQFNSVFLIKIPEKYMGRVLHRDGTIDLPVPLFRSTNKKNYKGNEIFYFTPHLVQGVYNKTTDSFLTNPNFSVVFSPNGLVYSDEQVNNFWSLNQVQWATYAKNRKRFSYEELSKIDKTRETFDEYMRSYSKYFKVSPVMKTHFSAKGYKRALESKKELKDMLHLDYLNTEIKYNK